MIMPDIHHMYTCVRSNLQAAASDHTSDFCDKKARGGSGMVTWSIAVTSDSNSKRYTVARPVHQASKD